MNAAEIEDEISKLADLPFDAQSFPYQFLQAFGVNDAALAKLKAGRDNKSDVPGGVLQRARNNIHLKTCPPGHVADTLAELRQSAATAKLKAKYILATDGQTIAAERLRDRETLACDYKDLPNHFGILLDLAGISTTPRIDENTFDIRATSKLNKLYIELLRHNPDWGSDARRQDLNHFFARLIFCFFAEDTAIFPGRGLFTDTVKLYTDRTGSNVHQVLAELFRAMDTRREDRATSDLRPFALKFPYVNGNLFGGSTETPQFTQAARIYLLTVGSLDWKEINPDIFGSMIQAVAADEERGELGMHYTSVPNILKVLNPLFLDDLRAQLAEAGDNPRKLLNLRQRIARIRVFDPACGSGNFLVIAYKEIRKIEAEINQLRRELDRPSDISPKNFRGIEIRHFAAEIARLALVIAKFQCDALYRGEVQARAMLLPLDKDNWITCDNALRVDWIGLCPPVGTGVKLNRDDLFGTPTDQAEIDFENPGGEIYICGNPPYSGTRNQDRNQKNDLEAVLSSRIAAWRSLDYVAGWLIKAVDVLAASGGAAAFVTTNSICQGLQVAPLWGEIRRMGGVIAFAHTTFKWSNLASHNAGVSVVIVGIRRNSSGKCLLYTTSENRIPEVREVGLINAYLVPAADVFIQQKPHPISIPLLALERGCAPVDNGHYFLDDASGRSLLSSVPSMRPLLYSAVGGEDFIRGKSRLLIRVSSPDALTDEQSAILTPIAERVAAFRRTSPKAATNRLAEEPFRFGEQGSASRGRKLFVPNLHSERREYLTAGLLPEAGIPLAPNFGMDTTDLFPLAIISSRIHLVWIATVCGKLETRYRYSNTLGWNTFPVPTLTDQNKSDLTHCAEDILLAREAHFPATIADMYDPERMDTEFPDVRAAHDRNDETLERIYIGRRFRNDTERLEKLFAMYTEMTGSLGGGGSKKAPKRPRAPKGGNGNIKGA